MWSPYGRKKTGLGFPVRASEAPSPIRQLSWASQGNKQVWVYTWNAQCPELHSLPSPLWTPWAGNSRPVGACRIPDAPKRFTQACPKWHSLEILVRNLRAVVICALLRALNLFHFSSSRPLGEPCLSPLLPDYIGCVPTRPLRLAWSDFSLDPGRWQNEALGEILTDACWGSQWTN